LTRFCQKCGAEAPDDAGFCPKCGSPMPSSGVVYRKERSGGWGLSKAISIIFGGFMLLVAMGLVFGGGAVLWSQSALTDKAGYMIATPVQLNAASYAIVADGIDVQMNMGGMIKPKVQDIISFKATATSRDGSPVFIGIAPKQYAENYLNGVNIDKVIDYTWGPYENSDNVPQYRTITGGAPSSAPTAQSFWVAQSSGSGAQTMTWTPTSGEYWVVVMNADGSKAVDVDVQVGVRVTFLSWIGWGLLIAGILVAAVGAVAIYFGVFRRP
jgi:hypothetical protein